MLDTSCFACYTRKLIGILAMAKLACYEHMYAHEGLSAALKKNKEPL